MITAFNMTSGTSGIDGWIGLTALFLLTVPRPGAVAPGWYESAPAALNLEVLDTRGCAAHTGARLYRPLTELVTTFFSSYPD
jgi:hypothetical protein